MAEDAYVDATIGETDAIASVAADAGFPDVAAAPRPVVAGMARGIGRLPPGPLGPVLERLTPIQRAVILAEILGPPVASRSRADSMGPRG